MKISKTNKIEPVINEIIFKKYFLQHFITIKNKIKQSSTIMPETFVTGRKCIIKNINALFINFIKINE